jgi:hypothetical protein
MSMEGDSINLVDMSKKVFVKIKMSKDSKYWEKWTSTNKLDWELSDRIETLEEVLKSQQELIDNNYKNLFDVISKK